MADANQAATQKSGRGKMIGLIAAGLFIIVGGSVGATIYFVGGGPDTTAEASLNDSKTPYYVELLDPKFSVNLAADSRSRLLKVSMTAMTYDPDVDTAMRHHLPQLRSNLMLVLSSQRSQDLGGRAGRTDLQKQVLQKVQQTLGQVGVKGKVKTVYFTGFVMQ